MGKVELLILKRICFIFKWYILTFPPHLHSNIISTLKLTGDSLHRYWTTCAKRVMQYTPEYTRSEMTPVNWEGVKPGTNARDPGPKSGTNIYGHQKLILRATIKIKIGLSVVYRVFSMMYIIVFPKISNCLNF